MRANQLLKRLTVTLFELDRTRSIANVACAFYGRPGLCPPRRAYSVRITIARPTPPLLGRRILFGLQHLRLFNGLLLGHLQNRD